MSFLKIEQKKQILQFITENDKATVVELCEKFHRSEATIRRYLDELSADGKLNRTHGGATRINFTIPEPPIFKRKNEHADAKNRIALATAKLISSGETIFLGSGSTVWTVAYQLCTLDSLTVVTNSLPIINLLAEAPNITIIALGGLVRSSELSMIGHIAEQAIEELRVDKVIIGMRSIHLQKGLSNDYLPETKTDRAIIKMAEKLILVADHTKFGRISPAFVAPLSTINTIVTDSDINPDITKDLIDKGINVIIA